ncbi:hypothetical protein G6F32_014626 [Rhizopus arrhizus]|nr:hypothetical protein G6F32_014626 [Rhizopus arrhizus]
MTPATGWRSIAPRPARRSTHAPCCPVVADAVPAGRAGRTTPGTLAGPHRCRSAAADAGRTGAWHGAGGDRWRQGGARGRLWRTQCRRRAAAHRHRDVRRLAAQDGVRSSGRTAGTGCADRAGCQHRHSSGQAAAGLPARAEEVRRLQRAGR